MAKKGGGGSSKSTKTRKDIVEDEFDDEIDAFHKQRDIVPLDVNDDDTDESDEDDVQPVFDLEGEEDDDDDDEDDEDDDDEDENGLTAKMIRQKKYLRAKFGDGDDDVMNDDDDDEAKEEKGISWGRTKSQYYNADNVDDPEMRSSDDEDLKAEEEEVMRLRAKQAASITRADVGLDDSDEEEEEDSDRELTMEEIAVKGTKSVKDVVEIEEIKKDINSLSKEEQMDVVYSSAPEIVGLLSELNDAVYELENKINPVMNKLKESEIPLNNNGGARRYMEVKQSLLLTYCQYITFYLLLKSEGQPIRDHPVLARLVEIKSLLDQIKELDGNLPVGFEDSLAEKLEEKAVKEDDDSFSSSPEYKVEPVKTEKKKKGEKRKHDKVNEQSEEMLRLRAALEGKLRSDGVLDSKSEKAQKKRKKLANGKLETFDDYLDDDATEVKKVKVGKFAPAKKKLVSGDDDLPQRDDIGERRRKFELRVLAGAGVKSEEDGRNDDDDDDDDDDDVNDMVDGGDNDDESDGSEDEFYKEAKLKHVAKRAAKEEMYSRKPSSIPSLPETVEGKRLISREIQSNRGLTRQRNKDLKNPRKKYRIKHEEKVKRRGGQVRAIKKQEGHYGGEEHGINAYTSKSIRIKS